MDGPKENVMASLRTANQTPFRVLTITCLLLLGLAMLPVADTAYAAAEKGPKCSDGIDNDGDGLIDGDDPDCGGSTELALEVREAFADQEAGTLVLIGGSFTSPVVTFGDAQTELTNESVTETTISAVLPAGLIAGDYAVNVADGGASTSYRCLR